MNSDWSPSAAITTPAEAVAPQGAAVAKGFFLLDSRGKPGAGRLGRIPDTAAAWIDGFAWRPSWIEFDTGTNAPQYDFHFVALACQQLGAMGKKLSLYVDCEEAPAYVVNAATYKYMAKVKDKGGYIFPTTCAPWDRSSLNYFKAFVNALANCPCPTPNGTVPLHRHPCLASLRFDPPGRTHTARDLYNNLISIPGWSRTSYVNACVEALSAVQDAFPGVPLHTGYFSISDGGKNPSLDLALITALAATFDGTHRDRIGFFEELLTAVKPKNDGAYAANLRAGRSRGFFIAFQSLDCWTQPFTTDFDPATDGIDPRPAIEHGVGDFGCKYFEMYPPDLNHPGWDTLFWNSWHQAINQ